MHYVGYSWRCKCLQRCSHSTLLSTVKNTTLNQQVFTVHKSVARHRNRRSRVRISARE
jgi:hypothetical protein